MDTRRTPIGYEITLAALIERNDHGGGDVIDLPVAAAPVADPPAAIGYGVVCMNMVTDPAQADQVYVLVA